MGEATGKLLLKWNEDMDSPILKLNEVEQLLNDRLATEIYQQTGIHIRVHIGEPVRLPGGPRIV